MLIDLNERLERKHASPVPKPEHRKLLIVMCLRPGWVAAYKKREYATEFGNAENLQGGTKWPVLL
jgi:hypothetical protein